MPILNQSPGKADLTNRIKIELRRLRIPGSIRGFDYLIYILLEVIPDPGRLMLTTKSLYPDTARAFGVSWSRVERSVRTAVSISWDRGGRETLDQMACHHLDERPTATQFIDIVADYIRRTS